MNSKLYLLLLDAIDELRSAILETNPNAHTTQLDRDIKELYDMVNKFDDPQEAE